LKKYANAIFKILYYLINNFALDDPEIILNSQNYQDGDALKDVTEGKFKLRKFKHRKISIIIVVH
jgi:hypothetical protein